MSRSSSAGYVLVVAVILVMAVVALRPTTTETETLPPVSLPDPGAASPVATVIAMRKSGGLSVFGFVIGEQTRTVTVQFDTPEGCYEQLMSGDPWPVASPECSVPVEVDGTVSGGGIAPTGESIVAVDVVVESACFESTSAGDAWPQPSCG